MYESLENLVTCMCKFVIVSRENGKQLMKVQRQLAHMKLLQLHIIILKTALLDGR